MPDERTRSLRFGWEFLIELRDCDSLTDDQRKTVEAILLHYPSAAEIRQLAKDCELGMPETAMLGLFLAPELPRPYVDPGEPVFPDDIERGPTTPQERVQALKDAYTFFRHGLAGSKKDNLPERLRRQIPYVLRHFPTGHEVNDWAMIEAREKRLAPRYKQWFAPTSAKQMVLDLAHQHGVSYVRTQDDALADVITRLTGDVVVTDEIEDLIVELKRAGAIDEKTMVQLLGRYLAEKKSA